MQKIFASLCLVSKQFLPHARSTLYYRPIPVYTATWPRALSLVNSLLSQNGHLVRSLGGVIEFVSKLGQLRDPPSPLLFQLRGYTKTFSLYYTFLSACPLLTSVELIFNSTKHLTKLLKALEQSSSTLQTIKFANSGSSPLYHISGDLVHKAPDRAELRNIENIVILDVDLESRPDSTDPPRISQTLTSLNIVFTSHVLGRCQHFLPQNSSNLRKLILSVGHIATLEASGLLSYLPAAIEELSISHLAFDHPTLANYQDQSTSSMPHEPFSRFSKLRKLSLHGFVLSTNLLEILTSNSPNVNQLVLFGSKWSPVDSSQTIEYSTHIRGILDPTLAQAYLSRFKHLKLADLGYLPTLHGLTYRGLEFLMEMRGIAFDWEECVDGRYCRVCGQIH